jgi:hypothetical protein
MDQDKNVVCLWQIQSDRKVTQPILKYLLMVPNKI